MLAIAGNKAMGAGFVSAGKKDIVIRITAPVQAAQPPLLDSWQGWRLTSESLAP
jgi:hypothetical protein